MLRLRLQLASFAIVAFALQSLALDLRPGLVEEWSVRHGGEQGILTLKWIDSAAGEGGTTDWTASLISLRQGHSDARDTAVLRVFDLAYLVDSGAYRPGRDAAWLKASCLMPFQRDDLDSVLSILFKNTRHRNLYGLPYFPMINRLPQGAMAEFCSGGQNTEKKDEVFGGWGTTCFEGPGEETRDCRATPPFRTAPGRGVVAWRSLQRQEDWRLMRFDGRDVAHPSGHLFVHPQPGATWIWTQGAGNDPPLWRMTVVTRLEDSLGIPGWDVDIDKRDGKGGSSHTASRLRIDTVQGWVGLGSEMVRLWAPYAPSMETRLALGFLTDWGVAANDTVVLVDDGVTRTTMGQYWHPSTWMWKAARGIGTLWIRNEMDTYPQRTDQWSLAAHSSHPVSASPRRSAIPTVGELRRSCAADPSFKIRRVSLDGRIEMGLGRDALWLLEKKGMAVFVIGEWPGERKIRAVVP